MADSRATHRLYRSLGLCAVCGAEAHGRYYCEFHRQQSNIRQRERKRRVLGLKRRYGRAESYGYDGQRLGVPEVSTRAEQSEQPER